MKNIYFAITSLLLSFLAAPYAQADSIDSCVEEKIDAYRSHAGEDAIIRMDIIGEWEDECSQGSEENELSNSPDFNLIVKRTFNEFFEIWMETIEFQATENDVTIRDIEVNRGGCLVNKDRLPFTLSFGQVHLLAISCPARSVLEVEVQSDRGRWIFDIDHG